MTREEKLKKVAAIAAVYYINNENKKVVNNKDNGWFKKNKEINMNIYKSLFNRNHKL